MKAGVQSGCVVVLSSRIPTFSAGHVGSPLLWELVVPSPGQTSSEMRRSNFFFFICYFSMHESALVVLCDHQTDCVRSTKV